MSGTYQRQARAFKTLRPIYTSFVRVVCDSDPDVCDRRNTHTN